jgi:hypothetical protein
MPKKTKRKMSEISRSQGVLFLRNVNGKSNWFEDGDEENDGKYIGEIENGKPNGTGTITFPDGRKYFGEFKDGVFHDQGTGTWSDGHKYVGEFKDGVFHGQGTYTSPDGRKYEGEWKGGSPWNGTEYDPIGTTILHKVLNGEWIKQ